MKKFLIISILAVITAAGSTIMAQDQPDEYLGLPGDNFNLYAVMNLFQQSETLEGFERSLNDENTRINNLDLNNDNFIDYIKVVDYVNGNDHTIVLRAVLGRKETQDVAVFTVQKFNDGSVQIQLTGDEVLYGRNYIIEPIYAETPNPGYASYSSRQNVAVVRTTYYEVAAWPLVRYIYVPGYVTWNSSWYWGFYPTYWNPWRPYYWHYYYGYHYNWYPQYYQHYRHCNYHRYAYWNDFYYHGHRAYSHNVSYRVNAGHYQATYSRPEQRKDGEALYSRSHPDRASSLSSGSSQSRRSDSQATTSRQPEGSAGSTSRRSVSTAPARTGNNTSTAQSAASQRRSVPVSTERKVENPSSGQGTSTARRTSPSSNQNTGNGSKSNQAVSERSRTISSSSKSSGIVSKVNSTVDDRARTNSNLNRSTGNVSGSTSSSIKNTGNVSRPASTVNKSTRPAYTASQNTVNARRSPEAVSSKPAYKPESSPRTSTARTTQQHSASVSSAPRRSSESSKPQSVAKSNSNSKEKETGNTSRRK